jgi:hypothetical protein
MISIKFDWNWPASSGDFFGHLNMVFLIVAPHDPPGTWFEQTWIYIRKLTCQNELFLLCGSWGEDFYMTSPHFCISIIISPLKRTWPLTWKI